MMNINNFEKINHIEMRVRSANFQIQSGTNAENLCINFSLITIARGSCTMNIKPSKTKASMSGKLHIPLDRTVIEVDVGLPKNHFDGLIKHLVQTADRHVTAKIELDKMLVIDHEGCLVIDGSIDASITNLTWTLKLK